MEKALRLSHREENLRGDEAYDHIARADRRTLKENGTHYIRQIKENKTKQTYKPLIAFDSAITRSLRLDKCFSVSKVNNLSFSKLYSGYNTK